MLSLIIELIKSVFLELLNYWLLFMEEILAGLKGVKESIVS
jgi:hypothetical protein